MMKGELITAFQPRKAGPGVTLGHPITEDVWEGLADLCQEWHGWAGRGPGEPRGTGVEGLSCLPGVVLAVAMANASKSLQQN